MNNPTRKIAFDFDEWQQLARSNPAAFEIKRHEIIAQFFEQLSPEQKNRLEKLQWRIDMERKRCATPLSALFKIYDMMMASLHKQKAVLDSIFDEQPAPGALSNPSRKNTVITMKQPSHS